MNEAAQHAHRVARSHRKAQSSNSNNIEHEPARSQNQNAFREQTKRVTIRPETAEFLARLRNSRTGQPLSRAKRPRSSPAAQTAGLTRGHGGSSWEGALHFTLWRGIAALRKHGQERLSRFVARGDAKLLEHSRADS